MSEIPESHPRRESLIARKKISDASSSGLLAPSAMIAHGRGEAFDYLLGEETSEPALLAIQEVARRLSFADRPVISVNGNTVILAGKDLLRVAAIVGCPIEVNLYYGTNDRINGILKLLRDLKLEVIDEGAPVGFTGNWKKSVSSVALLGEERDAEIAGLEGPRSMCSKDGIGSADAILVPLEDGDRCEALIAQGIQVFVVDLNPLSRSSRNATVTIVDEISRAAKCLLGHFFPLEEPSKDWDNNQILKDSLEIISESVNRI